MGLSDQLEWEMKYEVRPLQGYIQTDCNEKQVHSSKNTHQILIFNMTSDSIDPDVLSIPVILFQQSIFIVFMNFLKTRVKL